MPRTQPPAALTRWLAAEQSGQVDDAEAALAELLCALPQAAPPAGFADRVLARTALAQVAQGAPLPLRVPVSARAARRRRWAWRLIPALGLAAAAAALSWTLWLPDLLHALQLLLGAATISAVLQTCITAVANLSQWVAALVSLGNTLLLLVRAVEKPLETSPMALIAAACLLVSVLALRFLHALIQRDRRWAYADPI